MTDKFLYGASVQGIQSFIFETNKLKEIAGASELVEQICTRFFKENLGEKFNEQDLILGAAGNIRYIFHDQADCSEFIKNFPKLVSFFAPGIMLSQALISLKDRKLIDAMNDLEIKLKKQKNKIQKPVESGFMGLARSRRTGGVGTDIQTTRKGEPEIVCEATIAKRKAASSESGNPSAHLLYKKILGEPFFAADAMALDMTDITKSGKNSWIAVIHADGNGVGNILQQMGSFLKDKDDELIKAAFVKFSKNLERATMEAATKAIMSVFNKDKTKNYPFRPIILGGDDVTIVLRGDIALSFTETFLSEFEYNTRQYLSFLHEEYQITGFENGLSACAGIAYVKESYPFHYAVDLAESLCKEAKRFVKNDVPLNGQIPTSALSFFKVQDSFIENDLSVLKQRTKQAYAVSFDYGPYLIRSLDLFPSVIELRKKLDILKEEATKKSDSKAISKLRQWVTELYKDKTTADFMMQRMKSINPKFYSDMEIDKEKSDKTILYDVIQLHQLNY